MENMMKNNHDSKAGSAAVTSPALELQHISKQFVDGTETRTVLSDVSLTVNAGEFVAIVGPSGCGKSTLLNIAGMMSSPDQGSVMIGGQDMVSVKKRQWTKIRKEHIGFIFQSHQLLPYLRGEEQLSVLKPIAKEEKETLIRELGLEEVRRSYPATMSGGERQRFAIARAFAGNPDLILADEPTAALDSKRGRAVVEMIAKEVHARGKAAVMVTHDQRVLDLADSIYRMEDGQLVKEK